MLSSILESMSNKVKYWFVHVNMIHIKEHKISFAGRYKKIQNIWDDVTLWTHGSKKHITSQILKYYKVILKTFNRQMKKLTISQFSLGPLHYAWLQFVIICGFLNCSPYNLIAVYNFPRSTKCRKGIGEVIISVTSFQTSLQRWSPKWCLKQCPKWHFGEHFGHKFGDAWPPKWSPKWSPKLHHQASVHMY